MPNFSYYKSNYPITLSELITTSFSEKRSENKYILTVLLFVESVKKKAVPSQFNDNIFM